MEIVGGTLENIRPWLARAPEQMLDPVDADQLAAGLEERTAILQNTALS